MGTYTQIYYHLIFSTKGREPTLASGGRDEFLKYVWGVFKNNQCHLYRVNCVEDHFHAFSSLHPSVSVADLIKDVKVSTSKWIKENDVFPRFSHWQEGYGAFTHSHQEKDRLIEYVKNQEAHHKHVSFRDEFMNLLREAGIAFDEQYLE